MPQVRTKTISIDDLNGVRDNTSVQYLAPNASQMQHVNIYISEYTDVISYSLFLVLCNAFSNPGDVAYLLHVYQYKGAEDLY